jgi:hypothetical protein
VSALIEIHSSDASPFVRAFHELSVIFSKAKDETWSQHKHLHSLGNFANTVIKTDSHRGRLSDDERYASNSHQWAYREVWR